MTGDAVEQIEADKVGKRHTGEKNKRVRQTIDLVERARVRFPGFVSNIEDYHRASDVCVSSSRSEGLPFNVMEAMACGLPAVLTNVKGHEDLVRPGENGELYPYDDRQAFCRAVHVMSELAVRRTMGEKADKSVQKYGLDTVFPALTTLYYNALTGKTERAASEEEN